MVGIGNTFSGAKNDSDGGVESFMPLVYSSKSLPKKAHHKFQNKGTFSFSADDSQLQAFLASLGKSFFQQLSQFPSSLCIRKSNDCFFHQRTISLFFVGLMPANG